MGNTPSTPPTPLRPPPAPEADAPPLGEDDAWRMAVAWHESLFGFLRLATDAHHGVAVDQSADAFTIVEHFEWIEIDFTRDECPYPRDAVRAVRAATVAWFALSCCRGFGSDENPVFWKRVFSKLMRSSAGFQIDSVTERERFFANPDRPFPRICLVWLDALPLELLWNESLFGRKRHKHDHALDDILTKLQPYILPSRWARKIDVSVRVNANTSALTKCLKRINFERHASVDGPVLDFVAVFVRSEHLGAVEKGTRTYTHAQLRVVKHNAPWSLRTVKKEFDSLMGVQHHPHKAKCSHIQSVDILTAKSLIACCSVLPHKRTVSELRIFNQARPKLRKEGEGALLGYAIFHPDTAIYKSSVEKLMLELTKSDTAVARGLRWMAEGNNLLFACGKSTRIHQSYFQARVRAQAIVRSSPEVTETNTVFVVPSDAWMTLCDTLDNATIASHDAWVTVVFPGLGVAWIRVDDILEVQSRAPARSCVHRLRAMLMDKPCGDMISVLLDTLSVIGDSLTYLHIETPKNALLDAATVGAILLLCPRLTNLRIPHDGEYWADPSVDRLNEPKLRELELTIDTVLQPLGSQELDRLTVFSVACKQWRKFDANRNVFHSIMRRYRRLRCLNWHSTVDGKRYDRSIGYDAHSKDTRRKLGLLASDEWAVVAFPIDARVAFLSVLRDARIGSMAPLPEETIVEIFRWSESLVARQFHIRD